MYESLKTGFYIMYYDLLTPLHVHVQQPQVGKNINIEEQQGNLQNSSGFEF